MLQFRALASGSSGNAYLLQTDRTVLLFDAGLPLKKLERFLVAEEVPASSLSGILISHEHRDHCVGAADLASRYRVPVWANEEVLKAAGLRGLREAAILPVNRAVIFGDVTVESFPTDHDAVLPVAFRVEVQSRRIVLATDLGTPSGELGEAVETADLVVLEANHDTEMLMRGSYPHYLRRRVSGPKGHLSNDQAARVLTTHLRHESVDVWLAHLSRENNTPALATSVVRRALRAAGLGGVDVGIAQRDRPSLRWLGSPRPRQPALAGLEGAW